MALSINTELRKLDSVSKLHLTQMLDKRDLREDLWKSLMIEIPMDPDNIDGPRKYKVEHIQ